MDRLLYVVDIGVVNLDNEISESASNLISKNVGWVVIDEQIYAPSNCDGSAIDGSHVPSKFHPIGELAMQGVTQNLTVTRYAQCAHNEWTSTVVGQGYDDLVFKIVAGNRRKGTNGKPVMLSLRPQRKHRDDEGQDCSHAR
ncbi:hypothetical protein [Stenotrophomonas sp. SMYL20]|uniref:hypothetical protein n=1 Tax=Stenotrophomonas sp. SMYL20 TaxID=3076043 RepID=UPI002E78B341|nr:hypothetical protein [Stenotrophomonas sp. SMYL20]